MTPFGVDNIEIPRPPYGFSKSEIFEYTRIPGLDILFIFFITGLPLKYFKSILIELIPFLSSMSL